MKWVLAASLFLPQNTSTAQSATLFDYYYSTHEKDVVAVLQLRASHSKRKVRLHSPIRYKNRARLLTCIGATAWHGYENRPDCVRGKTTFVLFKKEFGMTPPAFAAVNGQKWKNVENASAVSVQKIWIDIQEGSKTDLLVFLLQKSLYFCVNPIISPHTRK